MSLEDFGLRLPINERPTPIRRMPVKLFEVRDTATTIPVMAVALQHHPPDFGDQEIAAKEAFLLRRAGYGDDQINQLQDVTPYIVLWALTGGVDGGLATYDPYGWRNSARTMPVAHQYIIEHWNELTSGDVIDVEFILGLSSTPKVSERETTRR
jgi:hypothetical protein